jgi:Holliday junction resolvasome RuvABC endonuclease subunit
MVTRLLELPDVQQAGDATDALAVALCHAHVGVIGAA